MIHFLPQSPPSNPSAKAIVFFKKQAHFILLSSHQVSKKIKIKIKNSTTLQLPKTSSRNKNIMTFKSSKNYAARASGCKRQFYEKNSHLHEGKGRREKILSVDRRGSTVTVYLVYKMLRQKHQSGKKPITRKNCSQTKAATGTHLIDRRKPGLSTNVFPFSPFTAEKHFMQ